MAKTKVVWKDHPETEDFQGAGHFLSLIYPEAKAQRMLRDLKKAHPIERAAKDLLRASALPLLPRSDAHVAEDLKRIRKAKPLAPILLIRGEMSLSIPLIVADGYHRICAICYHDEGEPIPCRLVSF
jgi:hypothetical protein